MAWTMFPTLLAPDKGDPVKHPLGMPTRICVDVQWLQGTCLGPVQGANDYVAGPVWQDVHEKSWLENNNDDEIKIQMNE